MLLFSFYTYIPDQAISSSAIYGNDSGATDLALLTILLENAALTSTKSSNASSVLYNNIFWRAFWKCDSEKIDYDNDNSESIIREQGD